MILSPLSKRIYALLIDTILISFTILMSPVVGITGALFLTVIAAALVLYDPLCVTLWGQTLGHRALGIKVVRADGETPSLAQALGRWIVKGLLGLWSFITMIGNGKAVHDLFTNTLVILADKKKPI